MKLVQMFSTIGLLIAAPLAQAQQPGKQPGAPQQKGQPPPLVVPAGTTAHRDLPYVANGHERQKLDLYAPEKTDGPLPVIIWVHGGGWQAGSKDQCPALRQGFTGRGYAVASLGYRLSSHATFPAQIEDCKAAIRWLRAHAKEYQLDPNHFAVWGSSAGGHLVALLGTSGDVKEFDVGANLDQSSRVQAVCDFYGPTDLTVFVTTPGYESHARADAPEGKLIGGAVMENKDKATRANPISFVSKDDPPFLIVHGDKDPTVPPNQSQLLFEALKKNGVSAHFHTIHGAGHGGPGFNAPEVDRMVTAFFEKHLKSKTPTGPPDASTSESTASATPAQPNAPERPAQPAAQRGGGISWDQVLSRNDKDKDGRLSREEFPGPPALFERMDVNKDGYITREEHERLFPPRNAAPSQPGDKPASAPEPKTKPSGAALPGGGLLYFASYQQRDNPAPAINPYLTGALFTIYWSDVETREGVFDWNMLDRRIAVWTNAGKKVALRIMWSSSGNWPEPAAKHPTPQFVLAAGAVTTHSESSKTDIPLPWDPIYRKYAQRFLGEVARKFDGDPNILFVDVTPGAETNPYRFRRINVNEPEFKQRYAETAASDGRRYSHELWLETVKQGVDDAVAAFHRTPLLVTLNAGSLEGPEQFQAIGDYCVSRGCYVGQNGLNARSYDTNSARKMAFQGWSAKTKFYFEMVDASGGNTGSLLDVMKAAERVGCNYLGVYAADVLRGTRGQPNYDPEYEAALAYGAKASDKMAVQMASATPTDARPDVKPVSTADIASGFKLDGERWTYRDGDFVMDGILLKPEGKGPFPAVLISHGMGGSAESFGLNKAREMVKWGFVCIAPDYTHSAKFLGARPGAQRPAGGKNGAPPANPGGKGPGFNPQQLSNAGASEENLKRARKCIELVTRMPEVDAARIAAYGHSMGGFVTIGLAAAAPDLLKAAAVSGSGVAPRAGFAAPSAEAAGKIRTPFLIMHGGADNTVRPAQSEQLKEILDTNQVPNERHVFEGEGHPIDQTKREEVFANIRQWFTKYGVTKP